MPVRPRTAPTLAQQGICLLRPDAFPGLERHKVLGEQSHKPQYVPSQEHSPAGTELAAAVYTV